MLIEHTIIFMYRFYWTNLFCFRNIRTRASCFVKSKRKVTTVPKQCTVYPSRKHRGKATRNPDVYTKWRWMISFTFRLLYPWILQPSTLWIGHSAEYEGRANTPYVPANCDSSLLYTESPKDYKGNCNSCYVSYHILTMSPYIKQLSSGNTKNALQILVTWRLNGSKCFFF
jgi:hypothetical protein